MVYSIYSIGGDGDVVGDHEDGSFRVDCNGENSDGDDGRDGIDLGSNGVDCNGEDDDDGDGDDSRYHDDEVGDDGHHMQGERSIQRQLGAMMEQVASMCENTLEYSSTPAPRPK